MSSVRSSSVQLEKSELQPQCSTLVMVCRFGGSCLTSRGISFLKQSEPFRGRPSCVRVLVLVSEFVPSVIPIRDSKRLVRRQIGKGLCCVRQPPQDLAMSPTASETSTCESGPSHRREPVIEET
jgi:hypothetical protein